MRNKFDLRAGRQFAGRICRSPGRHGLDQANLRLTLELRAAGNVELTTTIIGGQRSHSAKIFIWSRGKSSAGEGYSPRGNNVVKKWIVSSLLLFAMVGAVVVSDAREPPPEFLGLRLGMNEETVHRRLRKMPRSKRKRRKVRKVANRKSGSSSAKQPYYLRKTLAINSFRKVSQLQGPMSGLARH
jgi:hypothetical protein